MIHLQAVSKVFYPAAGPPVHALSEVSLDVAPGEFVVVRGPSGSGKSTLLSIIGGLARATHGQVVVAGQDLGGMSAAGRARFRAEQIGFVFQNFHLLPYLSVVDNVALAIPAGRRDEARKRAHQLLEQFQLASRLQHRPAELSIGECQRVAIARAMVNSPALILADEPTGNLDPQNAAGVLGLLAEYHRNGGTVLLVTHQEAAEQYARRIVLMQEGRLVPPG
ncbi:MAG: ABC transporter ATP-binding protein [Thermoguttaceae bacterium]